MQRIGSTSICLSLIASLMLGSPVFAEEKIAVDLELVLAVDISSSMDKDEQRLQRDGYVDALRHPAIMAAINGGVHGRIALLTSSGAIAMMPMWFWNGAFFPPQKKWQMPPGNWLRLPLVGAREHRSPVRWKLLPTPLKQCL